MRQGVSGVRRRAGGDLPQRQSQEIRRAARPRARSPDPDAARRAHPRPDGGGVRSHCQGLGQARFRRALHRVLAEGRAARARCRCVAGGFSHHHGGVLLDLHSHGTSGGAADAQGRDSLHDDLLRQPDGRQELQHHGRRQGGACERGALYRRRARPEGHPRARHLARTARHARRLGHPRIRCAARQGESEGAGAQPRQHRGRGRRHRLPRARRRPPHHRRNALRRRRLPYHGLEEADAKRRSWKLASLRVCKISLVKMDDLMAPKWAAGDTAKMKRKAYEQELRELQVELCHLQDWVKDKGARIIVVFEGRDAAGKGGTIKAISARVFRVVALPAPSDREKTQMFMQRYIQQFPAAGEIVIFDRSWYNRAGVEYVMGFCTEAQHRRFLELCPQIEKYIIDGGTTLIKVWLEVGQEEQQRRFSARINDPLRQWKLSPMDVESYRRWYDYSRARDTMLKATDSKHAPWYILRSDDKRRAGLNCISHILSMIPYKKVPHTKVKLPKRSPKGRYDDQSTLKGRNFVRETY